MLSACSGFNIINQYALRNSFFGFEEESSLYAEKSILIALIAGVLLATQLVDIVGRKVRKKHFPLPLQVRSVFRIVILIAEFHYSNLDFDRSISLWNKLGFNINLLVRDANFLHTH